MMTPTHKIYYDDPHITEFTATVLSCETNPETGLCCLILDRSAFFPEEGGQKADKGTINDLPVLDVQIENDVLLHTLPAGAVSGITTGDSVRGCVNWQQRFDFMQQHSGEHILSGLAHSHFGCKNVGFHLGYEEVTLDFDKVLAPEQVRKLEKEANEVICRNLPIQVSFPSRERLAVMDYRSKIALEGNIRIVEIPGVDICACCAPHADSTGQIGILKVTSLQNHRGGVRLSILCGMRAFENYTKQADSLTDISVLLSAKPEKIGEAVRRLKAESQSRQERINALQAKLLHLRLENALAAPNPAFSWLFEDKMDAKALRDAVNLMTTRTDGYCGIFSGNETEGYFYVIGSRTQDCTQAAAVLRDKCGAKGGGSPRMVQGTVFSAEHIIREVLDALTSAPLRS